MKRRSLAAAVLSLIFFVSIASYSHASSGTPAVTYTEHFDTTANWSTAAPAPMTNAPTPPTLVPSGGADGGSYISRALSEFGQPDLPPEVGGPIPVILFRAQDVMASSDHKFENNWVTGGLNQLSVYVRHDASISLPYFARFVSTAGGPGVVFQLPALVPASSTWQKLTFDISPSSPYYTPEGPLPTMFNDVMSDVGRLQIGYSLPLGFGTDPHTYTYDMDLVSTVPEPTSCLLLLSGAMFGLARRRRRATR